jgi:hypothetical protein
MTLRRLGFAAIAIGWIVSVAAYVARVPAGRMGFVVPIAIGFLIVLLGDLAIAWSFPAEERPSILRSAAGVVAIGAWATAGVVILSTWPASALAFEPVTWLPSPPGEAVTVVLGTALFIGGVLVTTLGALYSLAYLILGGIRYLARWASARGRP